MEHVTVKPERVAVVAGQFPSTSETFVLAHVTGLLDAGRHVQVLAFGHKAYNRLAHEDVQRYDLHDRLRYFPAMPANRRQAIALLIGLIPGLVRHPGILAWGLARRHLGLARALTLMARAVIVRDGRYDVVHCHFGNVANQVVWLKEVAPRTRFFVTFHGYDIRAALEGDRGMYAALFAAADGVFSVCRYNHERLRQLGCPDHKIIDLYNGVDERKFPFRRAALHPPYELVTVARLHKVKNIGLALELVRRARGAGLDVRYTVIGDGPLRADLAARAQELGIAGHVRFAGALTQEAVAGALQGKHVFVLTSCAEAFPVVVLEAMAAGLVVVAPDVGGIGECVRDGETGMLFPALDADAAFDRLQRVLRDPALWERVRRAGRERIERDFSSRLISRRLLNVYDGAVGIPT